MGRNDMTLIEEVRDRAKGSSQGSIKTTAREAGSGKWVFTLAYQCRSQAGYPDSPDLRAEPNPLAIP